MKTRKDKRPYVDAKGNPTYSALDARVNASEHTPTPWSKESSLFREPVVIGIFADNLKKTIAKWECSTRQDAEQMHADAAFIVRAVNSHEELIQMIKTLREAFYVKGTSGAVREAFASINERFKEIAKAEGK